jgi:hypothetical protein
MKTFGFLVLVLAAATAPCPAQQWEFGGSGGAGFLNGTPVTSPLGAATTGFKSGAAFGAFVGMRNSASSHFSGELHYAYLQSDLHAQSGGTEAVFTGISHVMNYDLVWHYNRPGSKVQFFVAVGGGMKIFRGTGQEQAYQPLSQFVYFTKTEAMKPMGDFGAGFRYPIARRIFLRAEFRDYVTPFPTQLITPAPGAKVGSILNDIVPMVGIETMF